MYSFISHLVYNTSCVNISLCVLAYTCVCTTKISISIFLWELVEMVQYDPLAEEETPTHRPCSVSMMCYLLHGQAEQLITEFSL